MLDPARLVGYCVIDEVLRDTFEPPERGRHLFLSPASGTRILPVRFLVRPEISPLVLNNLP